MIPFELTEQEQKVAQQLLSYMQNHPDAKHTAEGIARWWLLQQKLEGEINLVGRVIEYFTAKGILEKVRLADGNSYFKFRQQNLEGIFNVYSIMD